MAILIECRMWDERYKAGGRVSIIRGRRGREVERISCRLEGSIAGVAREEGIGMCWRALEGGDMGV